MTGVQPGSARWKQLVEQGIIKDGQRNWFLGEAALEIAPMGEDHGHNGTEANLRRYADEIGIEYGSLQVYRKVADAWPHVNRVTSTSWKVHSQLMAHKELIKPGMTVSQAAAALGHSNVGRTGPQASPEARTAAVKEYLTDPEVIKAVLADPDTARDIVSAAPGEIAKAQMARHQVIRDQVAPPGSEARAMRENMERRYEVAEVLQRLAQLRIATSKLSALGTLQTGEMRDLAEEAQNTLPAVQWLAGLSPDQADISDEIADFLRSQS